MRQIRTSHQVHFTQMVGCTLLLTITAFVAFGQTSNEVQELIPNQPLERQIKGGESQLFQFKVKAGGYARAEVEQKNIDVVVSSFAPDGKLVVEMDGKDGRLWREAVSCIAETGGAYRVEVKAYGAADAAGSYTIKLAEMRLSVPNDWKRLAAEAHLNAGRRFFNKGGGTNFERAIQEYEIAAKLWRELNEQYWEGMTLINISWTLNNLSRFEQAVVTHLQALDLCRGVKDRMGEGKAANSLGVAYYNLGQFDNALKSYEHALLILRESKDRIREGQALNNLGILFRDLRQPDKAREYYEQSLIVKRETKDRRGEGVALNNLGLVYRDLGQLNKARENYEQSLVISREFKDQRRGEGNTLNNLGDLFRDLKKYDKARDYYEQALIIRREIKDRSGEGHTLSNIGTVYLNLGQLNKAREHFDLALVIRREIKDRIGEGDTFSNLMYLFIKKSQSRIAVFYGKQAVNAYQEIRSNIKSFSREAQRSFLKNKEPLYRVLADVLISKGRFPEAQAVLDLLKEEEFKQILRRSGEPLFTLPYSKAEEETIKIVDNLATFGRTLSELRAKGDKLTDDEKKRLNYLEQTEIPAANTALRVATEALAKTAPDVKNALDARMKDNVQNILPALGKGVVALYTVVGKASADERAGNNDVTAKTEKGKINVGWILLVTPEFRKAYPIDTKDLEQTVFKFRDVLRSPIYNPQPLAQELYKKLFLQTSAKQKVTLAADLETYLSKQSDRTLMWSLDGVLRYLPMAVLHDGNSYLVEKYRNVVFNTASLGTLKDQTIPKWEVVGLGVSTEGTVKAYDGRVLRFAALRGSESELHSLIKEKNSNDAEGLFPGTLKLNADFTKEALFEGARTNAPVIHISSHFWFNAAKEETSFLLLGNGARLEITEFQDYPNLFQDVHLLSLSACDTATGSATIRNTENETNGKEVEGFAYVAQTLGAKSVIASLWEVSDQGTKELMTRFYKLRAANPQMSKGEAFRRAQLALLNATDQTKPWPAAQKGRSSVPILIGAHDAKSDDGATRADFVYSADKGAPAFKRDDSNPFAHPYYWAPFILIGNWK